MTSSLANENDPRPDVGLEKAECVFSDGHQGGAATGTDYNPTTQGFITQRVTVTVCDWKNPENLED